MRKEIILINSPLIIHRFDYKEILLKNNKLCWDSYRYNTSWDDRAYELRHDIERKLAIALIDPDWQEKLHDIINQITKELS